MNLCISIMMLKNLLFFFLQTVHKKTFYYLEQLILKHKLHQNSLNIKEINGTSMAQDFVNFIFVMYNCAHICKGTDLLYSSGPLTE